MKASEVAALLLETPDAEMLVRVGDDLCECTGVGPAALHNSAVQLQAINGALGGGVIVVNPDGGKLKEKIQSAIETYLTANGAAAVCHTHGPLLAAEICQVLPGNLADAAALVGWEDEQNRNKIGVQKELP